MAHLSDKFRCHRPVHCYQILFLMIIPSFHDAVHQTSLIRKKKQSLRFLVKTADRIYPHRVIQIFRYCHFIPLLSGTADDPSWLVKKNKDLFFLYRYGLPSIQILSSCDTFIPGEAVSPLTVIRSSSASLSASLLEQTPASLKNLLILIFSSIILLYIFSLVFATLIFLVFYRQVLYD